MSEPDEGGGGVRSLVVAHTVPWPTDSGGRLRLNLMVRGLAAAGPVDVFAFDWQGTSERIDVVSRFTTTPRPRPRSTSALARARWLTRGRLPLELSNLRNDEARAAFAKFVDGQQYDLAWFAHPPTFAAHRDQINAPVIFDCDDLEHFKHAARERSVRATLDSIRSAAARVSATANMRRWRSFYERAEGLADRLIVCSSIDAERLASPKVTVIPNGFRRPDLPAGDAPRGDRPPTVIFPGTMTYGPNLDAATFLVEEILPGLAERRPEMCVRIVGTADHRAERLHAPPRVDVTGHVESMAAELARSDVVVVPLRYGSGTRLKILEAFAHRIPVVSTTLGAEGLGIVHRETALLADTPEEFAAACVELLADAALRARLVNAAERLFLSRFEAEAIERQVAALARKVTSTR